LGKKEKKILRGEGKGGRWRLVGFEGILMILEE
jgi:hypothetical protein